MRYGPILGLALACAGCDKPRLQAETGEVTALEDSAWLSIYVKSQPGALVTCKPGCGDMTVDDDGTERVTVKLDGSTDELSIEVTVTTGFLSFSQSTTQLLKYTPQAGLFTFSYSTETPPRTDLKCFIESCKGKIEWQSPPVLTFEAPAGTVLEIGGFAHTAGGNATTTLPIWGVVGEFDIATLAAQSGGGYSELPIRAVFADGAKLEAKAFPTFTMGEVIGAIRSAPTAEVHFANEPALDPKQKPRAALLIDVASGTDYKVIGNAKKFRDIDLVGLSTASKRTIPCGSYSAGGDMVKVTIDARDADIELIDRRTGKSVAKRRFMAPSGCPDSFKDIVRGDKTSVLDSEPDEEAVKKWVSGFIAP